MVESPSRSRKHHGVAAQNRADAEIGDREAADRLRQAVRAAGGNKVVADRAGVPLGTVNNYVRGRNGMKIEALSALAAACNVSLEWLISGGDGPPAPLPDGPDYPMAEAAAPHGLGEAPPAVATIGGIDVRVLAKAIEIVAVIAGAADFQDDSKGMARRIATTYAMLIEPPAPFD
jgi:transcriptional regulator with XRE-family HTH domain